jgi:hypothetical protein
VSAPKSSGRTVDDYEWLHLAALMMRDGRTQANLNELEARRYRQCRIAEDADVQRILHVPDARCPLQEPHFPHECGRRFDLGGFK